MVEAGDKVYGCSLIDYGTFPQNPHQRLGSSCGTVRQSKGDLIRVLLFISANAAA